MVAMDPPKAMQKMAHHVVMQKQMREKAAVALKKATLLDQPCACPLELWLIMQARSRRARDILYSFFFFFICGFHSSRIFFYCSY